MVPLVILSDVTEAILKKLSVGGNPPGCNLEAPQKKFFSVLLIFTKLHFNDHCTQPNIVSAWQLPSHTRIKDNFPYRRYYQFANRICECEYFHRFKCLSDSIYTYNSHWHVVFDKINVSLTVC